MCFMYYFFIKSTEEIAFCSVSFQIQITMGNLIREQRLGLPLNCDRVERKDLLSLCL